MKRILLCVCLSILMTTGWLALPHAAFAQDEAPTGVLPPPLATSQEAMDDEDQVTASRPNERRAYGSSAGGTAVIQADPQTGNLFVVTDEETWAQMSKVAKGLDLPVPQVLVKVLFLEVTHTDDLDFGIEGNKTKATDNGGTTQQLTSIFGLAGALAGKNPGGYYQLVDDDLQITLKALANSTKLDVLSRPSVLVRNNQTANVTVGQQIPMITNSRVDTSGNTVNTIQYTNVGIILDVTPRITSGKMVEMNVAPQISALTAQTVPVSAGTNTVTAPVIAMRSATTTVIAQNGKTVVIGGMMQDNNTSSVDKVPILGSIPVLGALFRHTITTKAKTELLIFLTPYIVENPEELQDVSLSEKAQAEMSKTAFTKDEIDRYIEDVKHWPEKPLTDRPVPEGQPKASSQAPAYKQADTAKPQDEQPSAK